MLISYKRGQGSIVLRVKLLNSSVTTGAGLTGLAFNSSGLIISTIADNESAATAYTVAGSTIETITTLGTFAAPTATKCRFKEVDSTNHKGVYEIQIADARYAVSAAKSLIVSVAGATNLAECDVCIPLRDLDPYDAVRGGMTALPNANAEAAGGLFTRGTGAGQINQEDNGYISVNLKALIRTVLTETSSGYLAAAFKKFFDKAAPTGTINSIPDAVAGATGGLAIVGSQMDLKDAPNATAITAINSAVLTAISNLNNLSALANLYGSPLLEIPDSSSTLFAFTLVVRDSEGKLVDLDSSPTIAAANAGGTDRSANLSAVSHPSTGRYTFTYSVSSAAAEESLRIACSGTVSSEARYIEWIGAVVNYDSLTQIAAIKAKTDTLPSDPADASDIAASFSSLASTLSTIASYVDTEVAAIKAKTDNLPTDPADASDIAAAFSTVTATLATLATSAKLLKYVQLLARKDSAIATDNATELTAINASGGSGAGGYLNTTDSQEAIRDRGDAAWTTGGGGGGGDVTGFTDAALQQLAGVTIRLSQPWNGTQLPLRIVQGDDYSADDARPITITITGLDAGLDLTGAAGALSLKLGDALVTFDATDISRSGSDVVLTFEPDAADTAALTTASDNWRYDVQLTLASGRKITPIAEAKAIVLASYSP